jgi:hypothetical protein
VLSPVPVIRRPAAETPAADGCVVAAIPGADSVDVVAPVPGIDGEEAAEPLGGGAVVATPAVRPAGAPAEPAAGAVEPGAVLAVPVVPVPPGVLAVDPAVPEVPVAPAAGSVVAALRPVMPDGLVAVEVLSVFGGTWPPDRLTDVADVLLVIPGDAVGLVTPGVDALI